jgi:hypothetical protein
MHALQFVVFLLQKCDPLFPIIENWFVYGHVHRYSEFLEIPWLFSFVPVFVTPENIAELICQRS